MGKTLHARLKHLGSNIKTIFGMPNYQKYVEHHKLHFSNQLLMSEKEYYMHALKNRYESGKVNRCC